MLDVVDNLSHGDLNAFRNNFGSTKLVVFFEFHFLIQFLQLKDS
jgi:hypothetical protein